MTLERTKEAGADEEAPAAAEPAPGPGARQGLRVWFRPERSRLRAVVAFAVISIGLVTAGPQLLGEAVDVLFNGVVGQRYPAGETKAQVIAELHAHGKDQLASTLGAVDFVPGSGVDFGRIGRLLGLVALLYLLSLLFSWLQARIMAGVVLSVVYRLRQAISAKLDRLPLRYFDRQPHGDVLSRVTNDVDNVFTSLQDAFTPLITSVFTVLGILGLMFWISPLLAVISLVTVPLAIVLTGAIARRSKVMFEAQWEHTGRLNGLVEETHTGHAVVQAFGQGERMAEEFGRQNKQLYEAGFRAQFLSGVILPAVQFIGNLNFVIIAAFGGFEVANGAISLGAMLAFLQYSRRFTIPLLQIAGQINQLQSGLASAGRVFEFLAVPEEALLPGSPADRTEAGTLPANAVGRTPPAVGVELRKVSFRYDPDRPLIEDFTLAAAAGETVAIVGPTGAGKTTIVNLLLRFYEIDAGRILLDGADYRDLSREEVRGRFGMVLQDTWLFAGTIRDNIAYGRLGAEDEEIAAAARAAHADDFIATLPDGYDTVLDGEASGLSSGQRQLLTIARAFLANPSILILDEATSNVDTRTEMMIQDAMTRLRHQRTSFVIAHRLSTVREADTIVVMDAGRVVEQGRHVELLDRRGVYHELYNSQFADAITR